MDTFGPDRPRTPATLMTSRARNHLTMFVLVLVNGSGCRQAMYDQPRYKTYEASASFSDGTSARPIVAGTVPSESPSGRGLTSERVRALWNDPAAYAHFYEGKVNGAPATEFPFEITRDDLLRGQERYQVYCYPCHGATGDGKGMIVQRGFPPPPPFYGKRPMPDTSQANIVYSDLREAPVGHFFDVMTNGFGVMYSYASRIQPEDRWRIIAYIRALQLSQYASPDELEPADVQELSRSTSPKQDLPPEAQQ